MPVYTDEQRSAALMKLAANKLDFWKTAEETGISHTSLRNWYNSAEKPELADELELSITRLLMEPPKFTNGKDWAIALGILLDKLPIIQGRVEPQNPNNQTTVNVGTAPNPAELLGISVEELAVLVRENQKLLRKFRDDDSSTIDAS